MLEMGQKLRMWPIRPYCPGQRALEAEPGPERGLGKSWNRADLPSTEMSWMAKRRMMVQIMPRVIFRFPSTISTGRGWGRPHLGFKA